MIAVRRAVAVLCTATGLLAAQQAPARPTGPLRARTAAEDLQLFSQVFNQIRLNHPDSVDAHRVLMAAIQAMVQATDPHSYVIPAARLQPQKLEDYREGRLHPVPIEFRFVGGSAVVASVRAGTDAGRRDILPGDELVLIDGEPMLAESPLELEVMLSGPRNSEVTLTFERRQADGQLARHERRVKRERFSEETAVPAAVMIGDSTGYVRITTFAHDKVSDDLRAALRKLDGQGMQRLLLDLRQNGGGLVDEAARIAAEFLPDGAVLYTAETRRTKPDTGRVRRMFRGARDVPIIVLVDDGTASASELVAGALQDHDRALVVGQPSFGKSLMMRGFPLSDGSILMLVVGQLRTPCGRVIQRQYRDVTTRNYYRLAAEERDTAGRPTCRSDSGRVLYGGGGIYPDVRLPRPTAEPEWYRRVQSLDLPASWVGGYVNAHEATLTSRDDWVQAPSLADGTLAAFRAYALERGVTIPAGDAPDARLTHLLLRTVAYAKWGNAGLYQAEVALDPEIKQAMAYFAELEARGIK